MSKVGEPVLIYIVKLSGSEEHAVLMDYLEEGRVYRAFKIKPRSAHPGYRIPIFNSSDVIMDNFIMMGDKIKDETLQLEVKEVKPEDLEVLELSDSDIDTVCDFFGFTEMNEDDVPLDIREDDVVVEVKGEGPFMPPPEYKLPDKQGIDLANGVNLNYAKFLLYEIREKNPDIFLSIFNLIVQTNKTI